MAKRRPRAPETIDSILAPILHDEGLSLTDWCIAHDLSPRTVYRLRRGARAHLGTLHMLAAATGRTVDEIRAAIEASCAAAV